MKAAQDTDLFYRMLTTVHAAVQSQRGITKRSTGAADYAGFEVTILWRRPGYRCRSAFKEYAPMLMRLLVSSVFLAAAIISGCSPSNAPSSAESPKEESQPAAEVASENQYPRLNWKWINADGNEIELKGSPISVSDASFRVVEDKFRQLDWNDSASKPSLAIEHAEDQSLTIMLSPDPTGNHNAMIAVVRKPGPRYGNATSSIVRHSRPLNDAEQALSLLRSYTEDNEAFESLVEWVDQDAGSATNGD